MRVLLLTCLFLTADPPQTVATLLTPRFVAAGMGRPVVKVYPVRRFLVAGKDEEDAKKLINLMVSTISPREWQHMGGPGVFHYDRTQGAVVIIHDANVHSQVADLLNALDRLMQKP